MPGDERITASIAEWGEQLEGSAREILATIEASGDEHGGAAEREAEEFLQDVLSTGPILAKEICGRLKKRAYPSAR